MATELHFRFAINETMLEAVSMSYNELYEIKEKLEVEQEIAKRAHLLQCFLREVVTACLSLQAG